MKQNMFFSMKWKIALIIGLLAVVIVSLFGYLNYQREKEVLEKSLMDGLSLRTQITAEKIDTWLSVSKTALESRADALKNNSAIRFIESGGLGNNLYLKGRNLDYAVPFMYLGTPDKKFYYGGDWQAPPDFDPTSRPWYQSAVDQGKTIFTDYYTDAATGQLNISVATPLYLQDTKKLLGVLGIDLFLNDIIYMVAQSSNTIGISGALIDDKGIIIAHPEKDLISSNILDLKDDQGNKFMTPVLYDISGNQIYDFMGESKAMIWQRVNNLDWKVVLFISRNVIFAPLHDLWNQILIFIISTLIIFITLVYIFSHIFVKRIQRVSNSLLEISQGDGDLTHSIKTTSHDELTQLTINFNNFISLIRNMISNIKTSAQSTLQAKDTLVANTEETAASINEISATMNSMEKEINRLNTSIYNSSQSVTNISGSINNFNQIREEQAAIVEQTSASIEEMVKSLQNVAKMSLEKKEIASMLTETSQRGGNQLSTLSKVFNEKVVSQLSSIEEMTHIIRGIAGRINLLSMNAAIEAAHAGDSGKGFAVVAEEIRKLADSSSSSVKTIDTVINEIRNGVVITVKNTEDTAEIFQEMDKEVSDFVDTLSQIALNTNELMTGSQEIGKTAQRLNEITVTIKESATLIKTGTTELNNEMENITDVSRTVLGGIREAVVGASEIVNAMDQVTELSGELAHTSETLQNQINRFKT